MRESVALLAGLPLAACGPTDGRPVQRSGPVAELLADALVACAAGAPVDNGINQPVLAARGWRVTKRSTRFELESRDHPLDAYPALRRTEYEATEWRRPGSAGQLDVIRGHPSGLAGACAISARTRDDASAKEVVAMMQRVFRRAPDRKGERPRGGDFLTPRLDDASYAYYWALPRHDAYVETNGSSVSLSVLAMPDRAKLDQYSPDRPDHRIPTGAAD